MIYVSTGGFSKLPGSETAKIFSDYSINQIELSAGLFKDNQINDLKKLNKSKFQIHNYYPPPKDPFVFNLASMQEDIALKSISHVMSALEYCSDLMISNYSFHAGFLFDPKIKELGGKIEFQKLNEKKEAKSIFIERINKLSIRASELGINLLIENNVLSKANLERFKLNPFLMVEANECEEIMSQTSNNVKLLLDVGHLKVSAQSLNFDKENFFEVCNPWIHAYHLSDNNGEKDSNSLMNNESWFWSYLKKADYYVVEVYSESVFDLYEQYLLVKNKILSL